MLPIFLAFFTVGLLSFIVGAVAMWLVCKPQIRKLETELEQARRDLKIVATARDMYLADRRRYEQWLAAAEIKIAQLESDIRELSTGDASGGPEAAE